MQSILEALPSEFQALREFVHALARLVFQRRLFPESHPSSVRALEEAARPLEALLERKRIATLEFRRRTVHHLNFEVDLAGGDDRASHLLRETISRMSIGEIEFERGTSRDELAAFAGILSGSSIGKPFDMNEMWMRIRHIRVRHGRDGAGDGASRPGARTEGEAARPEPEGDPAKPRSAIGEVVADILQKLEKIRPGDTRRAGGRILEIVERDRGNTAAVLLLNSLREYDSYTFAHSVNVAVISTAIARTVGLDSDTIDAISLAALLHDIGKLYVPRRVIHKTGRLTPTEWQLIKKHPVDGERILREERLDHLSRLIAYEHHMRYDHTGYPAPKPGYELHAGSHIVRVADSYDALTTRRPYRRQISPYDAVKMMTKGRGMEFHPEYLDAFVRLLGNIPIGSVLLLDTGESVLVVEIGQGRDSLPRVKVLKDASGSAPDRDTVFDLNERDAEGGFKRRIVSVIEESVRDVDVGKYHIAEG